MAAQPVSSPTTPRRRRLRIALSVDFDALSGYLGTGHDPNNTLSDYSAGKLSANVGVGRLLKVFDKYGVADKVSWFIPGHSIETFPKQTQQILQSGAEIALHGYCHEAAYSLSEQQEIDVLEKCIQLVTDLQGSPPVGYRAPLYQVRESLVRLLQKHNFLYDSSLNEHDGLPYFLPKPFVEQRPHIPDYTKEAKTWMMPTVMTAQPKHGTQEADDAMVEVPVSWYTEDMTPLGFYPYAANTQGYVAVDVIEKIWWDRFEWLWEHESFVDDVDHHMGYGSIFPMLWHPESAGRLHIIGTIDKFIGKLVDKMKAAEPGEITFETTESVARSWKAHRIGGS